MRRPFHTLAAACVLALIAAATGRPEAQQAPPRFRAGVDVIRVEVSVLDEDRKPVRGLTRADFTILQDGKPQEIVAFGEVRIPDAPPATAASWTREVAPEVSTNRALDGRLVLLLLDDGLEPGPFATRTKEIARSVVERLGPDDQAAVVFTRDNRPAQDFTADRAKLYTAIDHFTTGFVFSQKREDRASGGDSLYYRYSIDTLGEIAKSLVDIPHRRKVLVYIGIGVPISVEEAATPMAMGSSDGSSADLQARALESIGALGQALRRARMSNVTVYSIDSAGLGGLEAYAAAHPGYMAPAGQMRDYLHTVAAATGGRAAVEVEDYRPVIERVFEENTSYYLIGYRATTPASDDKFRRLDVKVNRRGTVVRARSGFEPPKLRKKDNSPPSPLFKALAGVLPDDGIAMQVSAAPFARGKETPAVAIVGGLRHPLGEKRSGFEEVQLLTSAFTPEGQSRGSFKQTARLKLRADAQGDASYEVLSQIALKPGRYSLRIAAHNPDIGRTGSVYYDLVVPDFGKEPVSLSGALISAKPAMPAAPKNALSTITPVIPTSRRDFEQGDQAQVSLRIYQRGSKQRVPITVKARIADTNDAEVYSVEETIAAERFSADRAADYGFTIPLSRLAPGSYLLTFEAGTSTHSARRDVRFTVR